jgi:restriction system protein
MPAFGEKVLDTRRWSLELLKALEWKRFEIVCAKYFESLGFRARTTRAGADGGVDIHLYADGDSKPAMIVQCKAWNTNKVGIKPIRELFGVMASEGVAEGIFLTTSHFTQEAREFQQGNKLHLWDGPEFLRKIEDLIDEKRTALLRVATEGDFTTPTCPSCDIKMVARAAKGSRDQFWGCKHFPRCKQTFNFRTL